jgi:hypothetical protein
MHVSTLEDPMYERQTPTRLTVSRSDCTHVAASEQVMLRQALERIEDI